MESISVFDIFKTGVGPSSSHTLGPWRAAQAFLGRCREAGVFGAITGLRVDLFGSLAKTGKGHGTDLAVQMGLAGEDPETCDTAALTGRTGTIRRSRTLTLAGGHGIPFDPDADIAFHRGRSLPFHPNGLAFTAALADGTARTETYFSIGGGFILREGEAPGGASHRTLPFPIGTGADLLRHCREQGLGVPGLVRRNEAAWRSGEGIDAGLDRIWTAMLDCVHRGCHAEGLLPGGLGVRRRAAAMARKLLAKAPAVSGPGAQAWMDAVRARGGNFQDTLKWVSCFALAVNEENAAFGRVVTAPTNGSAGVIPAVLMYYACFASAGLSAEEREAGIRDFLLTAGEFGSIFKKGATLSAAMGGCQAEIGVSSAMAAAGLAQVLGASPPQAAMAAEIAMEHHLGMTCDPVGGLVQIPCIERNALGAIKAITACGLALEGDPGQAKVSLDAVIKTLWETAQDMSSKYKETSEGGLANQIAVNVPEC